MSNLESEYILSRFKEPKLLSDSGNDKVYLVLDATTNRPYIQRVFPKDANMDIYRQMQSLAPRNIPKIHYIVEGEVDNVVLEEYISGTRLDELIGNNGKFDARQIVTWVVSLCDTLKQLHDASPPIIHRDIKPSNIIITNDGTPKLIDFNISRNYKTDGSADTKALGTEYYAAPEQFGFAQTDKRTDIYAIGKLMIVLLTNEQQKPEDALAACGSLKSVIGKCCEIDPTRRYQDVSEVRKALAQTKANRFKRMVGIVAACIVISACYFGYKHLSSVPTNVSTSGSQGDALISDEGDGAFQNEPTAKPTQTPTAMLKNLQEPTEAPLPSWAFLPKPIFGLQSVIDEAVDIADALDKLFLTDTVKYLLGDKYDYFSGCMSVVEDYRYSELSDGYLFFYQEPENNNASNAYLEINDSGEVYIGLYYNEATYYFTNNPDKTSELHFNYLYYWFNFHGDSSVVFTAMSATVEGIGGLYTFVEAGQELSVTQLNGEIEYAIGTDENKTKGKAEPKSDYFETYIEDYGYLYFHFYDDCVFVFDKLLKSVAGNVPDYVGKYERQ